MKTWTLGHSDHCNQHHLLCGSVFLRYGSSSWKAIWWIILSCRKRFKEDERREFSAWKSTLGSRGCGGSTLYIAILAKGAFPTLLPLCFARPPTPWTVPRKAIRAGTCEESSLKLKDLETWTQRIRKPLPAPNEECNYGGNHGNTPATEFQISELESMTRECEADGDEIGLHEDDARRIHSGLILNGGFAERETPTTQAILSYDKWDQRRKRLRKREFGSYAIDRRILWRTQSNARGSQWRSESIRRTIGQIIYSWK